MTRTRISGSPFANLPQRDSILHGLRSPSECVTPAASCPSWSRLRRGSRRRRLQLSRRVPGTGAARRRRPTPPQTGFEPAPTRGYILISIDALRADHLGLYGYPKPTSPFLDELARRATVFDHAFAQVPSTLPSHMSMFTGLYPAEHGVFPPSAVLAPEIRTLPEILLHAGFRTAGHTEGGYVQGGYGFARGFGEWTDTPYADDTDVERTFGRGVAFLQSVQPGERFFLFLHTYTVHDPYWPPEAIAGCSGRGRRRPAPASPPARTSRRSTTASPRRRPRRSSTTRRSTTHRSAISTIACGSSSPTSRRAGSPTKRR